MRRLARASLPVRALARGLGLLLTCLLLVSLDGLASAEIYRWRDDQGQSAA